MKTFKIDIKNKDVRQKYSDLLKNFENEFSYPLGEKSFFIKHGFSGDHDYFSFFEQMGEVHYFIVEDKDKIVGAGCAVLRKINNQKVWYLCDFKISKEYRGRKVLEFMMFKYFVPMYFKAHKMILVNMSNPNSNGLISKVKKMFKAFKLNINELYFFEWSKSDIEKSTINLEDFYIIHNKNKKDIVIDNNPYHIYHLVNKNTAKDLSKFQFANLKDIKDDDIIMLSSILDDNVRRLMDTEKPSTIGTIVSYGVNDLYFSSAEI